MATPIFRVKWASSSQDTVDYIVQRAARKNSSGNPGLITLPSHIDDVRSGRAEDIETSEGRVDCGLSLAVVSEQSLDIKLC